MNTPRPLPPARILHRNLAVLRVADAIVLHELRMLVPIEEYVLGEVSPTELVIDPARLRALLDLLEARGLSAMIRRVSPDRPSGDGGPLQG